MNRLYNKILMVVISFLLIIVLGSCREEKIRYNTDFIEKAVLLYSKELCTSMITHLCEWLPDERGVIFIAWELVSIKGEILEWSNLYRVDLDGKNLTDLTPRDNSASYFSLSPDGKTIAIKEVGPFFSPGEVKEKIYLISLETGERKVLMEVKEPNLIRIEWSPDGKIIGQEIYYKIIEDINVKIDTEEFGTLKFSPDGKWIAYTLPTLPKESGFWLEDLITKEKFHIGKELGKCISFHWSPDSSTLYFQTSRPKEKGSEEYIYQNWILEIGTMKKRMLEEGLWSEPISWSIDSKEILYEDIPEIKIWDLEKNESRSLGKGRDPRWSPDNSLIAYLFSDRVLEEDLWIMKPDGSGKTRLTYVGSKRWGYTFPKWSPDGKKILYITSEEHPKYNRYTYKSLWLIHLKDAINDLKR